MNDNEIKNTAAVENEPVMQASNIDEDGNVLYLDEERLKRKEVGFKRWKNRSNGLGIFNWLTTHVIHLNDKRWPIAIWLYKKVIKYSSWLKEGGWKAKTYKKITKLFSILSEK